jgi:hypothetical protein
VDPRTKAIDDVREIFSRAPQGPPTRKCPSCGAEHATLSPFCPSCDKRYDRRFARVSDRQRWALGGLALVAVIVAAVLVMPACSTPSATTTPASRASSRRASRPRSGA